MNPSQFTEKEDVLAFEEDWFAIPERKEILISWIGRDKKVLDVGCQSGRIAELIRNQRNRVIGVEVNPDAARAAERRGIPVRVLDVEKGLPFEDRSFDVVHVGSLIESLFDTKSFLRECRRVLKTDGQLILLSRNVNHLENRIRAVLGRYPSGIGAFPEDHHGSVVRVFNPGKLRELLAECGFGISEMRGISAPIPGPTADRVGIPSWLRTGLRLSARVAPGLAEWTLVRGSQGIKITE